MEFSRCPFCHLTVRIDELDRHANDHFEDEDYARDLDFAHQIALAPPSPPPFVEDSSQFTTGLLDNPESSSSKCDRNVTGSEKSDLNEKYRGLVGSQVRASFYHVEGGLMSLLRNCLELDSKNSVSILSGYVDHFQSMESEDVGWGCGWRNIQMLSSHLIKERPEAREVLYGGSGFVPDIASLQRWLELAWEKGFDTAGSNHFDQKIFGKRNWIGTTECAALLRCFGLRASIVDFCSKDSLASPVLRLSSGIERVDENVGKRKVAQVIGPMDKYFSKGNLDSSRAVFSDSHEDPKQSSVSFQKVEGHELLLNWVWSYFSADDFPRPGSVSVVLSEKPPLYFQHAGHSRTIVGIQATCQKNGMQQSNLLILDPAEKSRALEKSLREKVGWQKLIKRGVHTLRKPHYQLCYIDPGIACADEMEKLKTLHGVRFEF